MTEMSITLEDPPGPDEHRIWDGLLAFNRAANWPDPHRFAVFVRDASGMFLGGGRALVHWDVLYVDDLWLDERIRGRHLGTQVMNVMEAHGAGLGARLAWLDTMSWQARPFYEKRGYEVFGELPYEGGRIVRYWLRKNL